MLNHLTVTMPLNSTDAADEPTTHVLDRAKSIVYNRPDTHGDPEDSFETIAHFWNIYINAKDDPMLDAEDVANLMVLLKVARNAEGHYHEDNYVDIAGYAENGARLASEVLEPETVRYVNESENPDHPLDPDSYGGTN